MTKLSVILFGDQRRKNPKGCCSVPGCGCVTIPAFLVLLCIILAAPKHTEEMAPSEPENSQSSKHAMTVFKVSDGDTISVRDANGTEITIRLYGIDAPELKQKGGAESKNYLSQLVKNKTVSVYPNDTDQYGRTVAHVYVGDKSVPLLMIESGNAWYYKQYAKEYPLENAEIEARRKSIGIWKDSNPIPPWEWRNR